MARRMRSFDWSQSALGPVGRWPDSLRTAVGICLASRFPIVLLLGREYTILYNDAYRQMLGTKHPEALGQPCRVCWPEIWDTIGPMLDGVVRTGEATWSNDMQLVLQRNGYPEECYFSFSYSPLRAEGVVEGVFTAVVETTERVLGERRLDTLRNLAERTAAARSVDEACARAADVLDRNAADVPFSLVYLLDHEGSEAKLAAWAGIRPGTDASPDIVRLGDADSPWPIQAAVEEGRPQVVRDTAVRVQSDGSLPAPDTALVLPLAHPGLERPAGVLVAGVSPRQALGDDYRSFFDLAAGHVAAAIAEARAFSLERERAEALAELDRAKTSFFSSVSHEFRTPLTLMLGPLEEMLESAGDSLPQAQRSLVDTAHRNGLRLLKLVNTLLDFARLESGRLEAVREPVDLGPLTANLASTFRSAIEKAGLKLRVDSPALDEPVFVQPDMWEKIVLNLLSNAFKFTFAGEIDVGLRRVGDEAVLTVSDTGVGIAEAELPRIFERFHQVRAARSRTHEGSGIGLALVRELVALHGGRVEVASQVGRGTRFTIRLPCGTAHLPGARIRPPGGPSAPAVSAAPFVEEALRWLPGQVPLQISPKPPVLSSPAEGGGGVDSRRTEGARVLVADDNADMRAYLFHLLSPSWKVEVVNDGQAALASATTRPPDLVLTDLMMPGLDGLELVRALRRDPRTAAVPVLVLSARAGQEATVDGLESGADDYLVKPFAAAELLARVRANLELSRTRLDAQASAARLEVAQRSQGHALEVLEAVSRLTEVGSEMTEFFLSLTETVARLVSARQVIFLTLQENDSLAAQAGAHGFTSEAVAALTGIPCRAGGDGIVDRVVHGDQVYRSRLVGEDPEIERYRQWRGLTQVPDVLAVAWKAGDRPIGMVAACDSTRPEGFTDEDVWVLSVAGMAAGTVWLRRLAEVALGEMRDAEADRLREAARRAAELEKAKSEFLHLASHELRGPVTVLRGYLSMMHEGEIVANVGRTYEILLAKVDEINLLIEQMLETARLEDRRPVLNVESIDVREVAQSAARAFSMRLTDRHHLKLDLADKPVLVTCDRARLSTILSNLLDNAIKYSPHGGTVLLSCRVNAVSRHAEISVSDEGIGIEPGEMRTIFTRFGRVVNADNSHIPGPGLGLYVARQLARLHGGDIDISSRRKVGTTVVATLPLAVDI